MYCLLLIFSVAFELLHSKPCDLILIMMVKRCDALCSGLFSGTVSGQVVKEEQIVKAKAAAARRSQIERRDLESQIQREIVERFPEFGYVDTDVRMIDNNTLRMELREGKM